jgi:hypothetical protein
MEPFCFDRSWFFPLSASDFWSVVSQVEDFPRWWGWLRSLEADGLVEGGHANFVVQSALPFQLRFSVDVDHVDPPREARVLVDGDLRGPARLEVTPLDDGCSARLWWELEPQAPLLRTMASLSRPLMAWSHDQIVRLGVAQFRRQVIALRP